MLARNYPRFRRRDIRAIMRRHGLTDAPVALLLGPGRPPIRRLVHFMRALRRGTRPTREEHPLFSASFYRATNPDIASAGIDPWLHYQVFGRAEGRSPHPFIDVSRLAGQLPDTLTAVVVDAYLMRREHWLLSPSPYIETEHFAAAGPWDGVTHPLVQIAEQYPAEPWVRARLSLIDLVDARSPERHALAALMMLDPRRVHAGRLSVWSRTAPPPSDSHGAFRVVPGFFAGLDGTEIVAIGREVVSRDGTAVRNRHVVAIADDGERYTASTLVVAIGELDHRALGALASRLDGGDIVAPVDVQQERALNIAGVRTLPFGRQAIVEARHLELCGEAQPVQIEAAAALTRGGFTPPKVRTSGVIAAHNQLRWIETAIRSLAAEADEVVVVDDGSTDGTAELLETLVREEGFTLIRNTVARGVSEAYAVAVEASSGEILLIQGGDDRTLPGRAAASIAALSDPSVSLVHSDPVVIDADGNVLPHGAAGEFQEPHVSDVLRYLVETGNFICAPSVAIRREDYLAHGGFPAGIALLQDYALWIELARVGRFDRLDAPVVEYRKHGGNLSREYTGIDTARRRRHAVELSWVRERFIQAADRRDLDRLGAPAAANGQLLARDDRALLLSFALGDQGVFRRAVDDLLTRVAKDGVEVLDTLGIAPGDVAELIYRADPENLAALGRSAAVLRALGDSASG
ncbi:glycosyltransferase [Protaetiibacter intestinalis]|uniref:Glycosyltransferase n=2 Tax=Protaetiibacter intestinalis TaxID=2419774 RepID=A0A387BB24_9MICO|nr:glycosyltransferase [Protaetiibacter intestinalis]